MKPDPKQAATSRRDGASAARKPRVTAQQREVRRRRIFACAQAGWSHQEIADAEHLSRERVRQIVVGSLERRTLDPPREHGLLQIARLKAALRLAAEKVAQGHLGAIERLLRVLARLDAYQGVAAIASKDEDDAAFQAMMDELRRPSPRGGDPGAKFERQAFSPASH